jgi:hypothetical protein
MALLYGIYAYLLQQATQPLLHLDSPMTIGSTRMKATVATIVRPNGRRLPVPRQARDRQTK